MNTYTLNAGHRNISISTSFKIKENELAELAEIASEILFDFNHVNSRSSAYHFNDAPVGSVLKTTDSFFFFLKTNAGLAQKILGFAPFSSLDPTFLGDGNLISSLELFPEEKAFVKWKPMKLDSHILRTAFLIDTITEKLKKKRKKKNDSFFLQFGRFYRVVSNDSWKIDAKFSEHDEPIEIVANDHSVIVAEPNPHKSSTVSNFLSTDTFINHKESHIRLSDDMISAVVLLKLANKLSMQSEYKHFSQKYEADLYTLSEENKTYLFTK